MISDSIRHRSLQSHISARLLSLVKASDISVSSGNTISICLIVYLMLCDGLLTFDPSVCDDDLDSYSMDHCDRSKRVYGDSEDMDSSRLSCHLMAA